VAKCLVKNKEHIRVSNTEAKILEKEGWKYCSKSDWQRAGSPERTNEKGT